MAQGPCSLEKVAEVKRYHRPGGEKDERHERFCRCEACVGVVTLSNLVPQKSQVSRSNCQGNQSDDTDKQDET